MVNTQSQIKKGFTPAVRQMLLALAPQHGSTQKEEVSDCFPQLKIFLLLINSNQLPPNPKTQIEVIHLICHLNNKLLHPAGLHHGVDLGRQAQRVLTHCLVKDEEGSIGPFKAGELAVLVDLCLVAEEFYTTPFLIDQLRLLCG